MSLCNYTVKKLNLRLAIRNPSKNESLQVLKQVLKSCKNLNGWRAGNTFWGKKTPRPLFSGQVSLKAVGARILNFRMNSRLIVMGAKDFPWRRNFSWFIWKGDTFMFWMWEGWGWHGVFCCRLYTRPLLIFLSVEKCFLFQKPTILVKSHLSEVLPVCYTWASFSSKVRQIKCFLWASWGR